ncbi:MAG: large conductance mechanosensitive channel protein MscL, partial [Bacillales bacterium]|nr:large conductance mechanosensitive channel protein MscL [Bacillales bacterium]
MKKKKTSIFQEFKKFITRGSVIDLAVGMIIGASFTAIVTSLVNDILMPSISFLLTGIDLKEWKFTIIQAVPEVASNDVITQPAKAAIEIRYGLFIQAIINFI